MQSDWPRPTVRMSRGERRAQLLVAAREVFVAQGFHATAMDDIADVAGVTKPVLYQHFSSKLALYQALLGESAAELVRRLGEAIASSPDNQIRVTEAVGAYFAFVSDEKQTFRLIFESDLRDDPGVAQIVDSTTEACVAAISDTITKDTGTDPAYARILAAGLVGISQVGAQYWLAQSADVDQQRAVELLSTLAWRGISHFPRVEPAG